MTYENETCEGCVHLATARHHETDPAMICGHAIVNSGEMHAPNDFSIGSSAPACHDFAPSLKCRSTRAREAAADMPPIIVLPPGEWTSENAEGLADVIRSARIKVGP